MQSSFYKIVSNLSFSPTAAGQLTFYLRRLQKENVTRKLSLVAGLLVFVFQIVAVTAPAQSTIASSPYDIIRGGFETKADLLRIWEEGNGLEGESGQELREIYKHFGIRKQDIEEGHMGFINSGDHKLMSLGRLNHSGPDIKINIGGKIFYQHALYHWKDNTEFKALIGKNKDGEFFAILKSCGNPIVKKDQPAPPPPKPPKPPKPPTPNPLNPEIVESKSAVNLTQVDAGGNPIDAESKPALAGDLIRYTLTTTNTGTGAAKDYVITEEIADILEYADVADLGNSRQVGTKLVWPKTTIAPNEQYVTTFTVRIKSPVPTTPRSSSDPLSFDLRMDNVYGNDVKVPLVVPPIKEIEITSSSLPQTGPLENILAMLAFTGLLTFFYMRNRQLATEIKMLRADNS